VLCFIAHLVSKLFGRSPWPRRFLAGFANICGVDVRVDGKLANSHSLLVPNHTSWLDIPVLATATGCAFVSKAELRGHPVMKWLADQNRTVYVDRSDRRGLHDQTAAVREALVSDQPLALFPEGTVSHGGRLLPFTPALLTAVTPPPPGCAIQPVAIDYGAAMLSLGWAKGEHGVANAIRILGRKGRMTATVRLLEPLDPSLDRKAMAKAAHDAIAAALAPSGIAPAGL
jgi:1-acyl-sn-glycerol-3-phosphate acyltransferase